MLPEVGHGVIPDTGGVAVLYEMCGHGVVSDMVLTGPNLPHVWRSDNAYFDPANELETHLIVVYFPEDFLGDGIFEKEEFEDIARLMKLSARGVEVNGKSNREVTEMMKKLVKKPSLLSIFRRNTRKIL